jgi:hypothetical protein
MQDALSAVGHTYKNFVITKYLPIDELQSTLIELVHEPTGAIVLHIANNDPENVFCLSFQTLPDSSNGAPHILEHTVLCGSKKYPVKDPFFAMTRRSLNTFMNAFTGQDFTCYPASSQVEKDFYNLLEVYLDAVFHPELKKLSFLQEGHRLELGGKDGPLQFQGVVYNEMKGAMTSSESRLWQAIAKHLTPNLPYAYNSGGDPKEIPNLSYEELIEFHRIFYHPSRCLFYFYGNLPLAKHLDFIEQNTLQGAKKLSPLAPLKPQPRYTQAITAMDAYPIASTESPENKAEISFSWLTAHLSHQSDVLALCLIECLLMETDASFLKKSFLKSGLCKEAESNIDVEMSEVPFVIVCKGCDPVNEPKLKKLLFTQLKKLAAKPIDPELIEAALHQLEFQRTEIDGEGGPFGLSLFMRAGLIKQHGSEPEHALQIHTLFAELRDRLKDPAYLSDVIRKYLIENQHFVSLTLAADPTLEKKEKEEEQKRLEAIGKKLTKEQKKHLQKQSEELLKYQESIEHQSLDCLPKVTLKDVPRKARDFPLTHHDLKAFDLFSHDCFTNQIVYADLLFDLPHIEAEDFPLLSLLVKLWTELGCGGRTYEETLQFMQAHTGDIDAHLALHISAADPNVLKPAFSLRGKALGRKAGSFFRLLTDFAKGPNFSDEARITEWIGQHATELEHRLTSNALNYAVQTSLSGDSTASWIFNQWHGLPYYRLVKDLAKKKKGAWIDRFAPLAKKVISSSKPHLILACSQEQTDKLLAHHFYDLGNLDLPSKAPVWKGNYSIPPVPSQARLISSPVAFTAMGLRTSAYADPGVAELMISTELLGNVILHKEIREKGGAYGSGASYSPTTGNYHLYSFRDPHLARTIDTFRAAIEKIGTGGFSERELEEAKLGIVAAIDTPVPPGGRAIVAYAWYRSGRTLEDRQKLRGQLLSCTKEQVMHAVQKKLAHHPATLVTLIGQEMWEKESPKLKNPLALKKLTDL